MVGDFHACGRLQANKVTPLRRKPAAIFQLNIGLYCNQVGNRKLPLSTVLAGLGSCLWQGSINVSLKWLFNTACLVFPACSPVTTI